MEKVNTIVVGNRIRAVDFSDIIRSVEADVIDRLWDMDLLDNLRPTCKVFRRLFQYNVIRATCDFVLNYDSDEKLIFIISDKTDDLAIFDHCVDKKTMKEFIDRTSKIIARNLPINFYSSDLTIESLSSLDSKSGEVIGFTNDAIQLMRRNNTQTFEKIKKFVKDNGLTFLSESYFKDIRTKNILFA